MPPYRQSGISLISLMIGLLISMVALLGMLSLYSTIVKSTVQSSRDARVSAERSSTLLVAHRYLQGAGYGIDNASRGTDMLLFAGTTLDDNSLSGGNIITNANPGNTLLWRTQTDGSNMRCSGLHAPSSNDQGGLYLLRPQSCSPLAWPDDWEVRPLLVDSTDAAGDASPFTITLKDIPDCKVLGVINAGGLAVTLGTSIATSDNNDPIEINSTTCLLNFASGGTP